MSFGQVDLTRCGPTGSACKNAVKIDDLTNLLTLLDSARDCARACALKYCLENPPCTGATQTTDWRGSRVDGSCNTCQFRSPLEEAASQLQTIINRLQIDINNGVASVSALNALQAALLVINGQGGILPNYNTLKWEQILNHMDGSTIANYTPQQKRSKGLVFNESRQDPNTGRMVADGTVIGEVLKARDHLYFSANATPAQDSQFSAPIIREITNLDQMIERVRSQLRSESDPVALFDPTNLAPIQEKFSSIARSIREAWISNGARTRLRSQLDTTYSKIQEVHRVANREGRIPAEALNNLNTFINNVSDSIAGDCAFYDISCLWQRNKWKVYAGIGISLVSLVVVVKLVNKII